MEHVESPTCRGRAVVEMRGHLYSIQCSQCGWTKAGTAYPGDEAALMDGSQNMVEVQIVWSEADATLSELVNARRTFPELADVPPQEMLRRSKEVKTYTLGTFRRATAIGLQERGAANGITVSITEPRP